MTSKEWIIPAGGEFRFEMTESDATTNAAAADPNPLIIRLLEGQAEVFGVEMASGRDYTFSGGKLAIFSYTGARILQSRPCQVEYLSTETPLPLQYLNTHAALSHHQVVMVVGVGRTSLTKTLLNYAVRAGGGTSTSILVDLSLGGQSPGGKGGGGLLLFPGTLSAMQIDRPGEVELAGAGWGAGDPDPRGLISFFLGHWHHSDNPKLYGRLVGRLGELVREKSSRKVSPVYILLPAEPSEALVAQVQQAFAATVLLVVGNERLHSTLSRGSSSIIGCSILRLPKSGGVVSSTDLSYRRACMQRQFKAYFYGPFAEYTPFTQVLSILADSSSTAGSSSTDSVTLWRLIGEEAVAPASALPVNATRKVDETRLVRVDQPTSSLLLYAILAVCHPTDDGSNLLDWPVAGYLYVTAFDQERRQLTVLSPSPGRLPSPSNLLVGSIKWIEN